MTWDCARQTQQLQYKISGLECRVFSRSPQTILSKFQRRILKIQALKGIEPRDDDDDDDDDDEEEQEEQEIPKLLPQFQNQKWKKPFGKSFIFPLNHHSIIYEFMIICTNLHSFTLKSLRSLLFLQILHGSTSSPNLQASRVAARMSPPEQPCRKVGDI